MPPKLSEPETMGVYERGTGSPEQLRRILQEIADAYGCDEHGEAGRAAQRPVGQALDDHAEHGADEHGQQHGDRPGQTQVRHGEQGYVAADHDDVAVGES